MATKVKKSKSSKLQSESSDQEPPEFAIEAGEDFLDDDIPNAPTMSDFCQDLESLNIEVTKAKSPTVEEKKCTSPEEISSAPLIEEISSAPFAEEISSAPLPFQQTKETVMPTSNFEGVEEVPNAPSFFEQAPPIYIEDVASAPRFEVEASAPVFEEELAQEAQEEELETPESEAAYAAIQPFTESQLRGLYRNVEISRASEYVSEFLSTESETSNDSFYQLIHDYQRSRLALLANEKSYQKLKVLSEEEKMKVWTLHDKQIENEAECQDGKRVVSIHRFQLAEFNASAAANLTRTNKEIRELLLEDVSLYLFQSNMKRLRVEELINDVCNSDQVNVQRVQTCISVLFSFTRMRNEDEKFVRDIRFWLDQFVGTLLSRKVETTFEHHLFILNHVLRCPAGFGRWAACYIQPPAPTWNSESEEIDFQNPQLNQLLALISTLLSPVRARQEFLLEFSIDFKQTEKLSPQSDEMWTVLDSDGEEDDADVLSHSRPPMRENDLVAIFNQIPIDSLFRYLLKIDKRDNTDIYNPSAFSVSSFMKLFAFGTQFIQLLKEGLNTFDAPSYRQFAKRIGRLVRHTVQYVSDHWQAYRQANEAYLDSSMVQRIQVEHDSFFLRAVKCIFSSKKLGMWQYLAVIPYGTVGINMVWKIYYFLHFVQDQEAEDETTLENLHVLDRRQIKARLNSADVKIHFSEALESVASTERLFLLTAFSNMASARKETDREFIEHVCLELIEIGFLTASTFETCCKGARDMFANLAQIHPWILSFLVTQMEKLPNLMGLGKNSLYLCKECPFSLWRPENAEIFGIVCKWLIDYPPSSCESQIARLIFGKMNWTIEEVKKDGMSVRPLDWTFHRTLALAVVEANLKHAPDVVQETGILQEGVRQMSNLAASLYKKSPEQVLTAWSWEMVSRLRLHATDQSDIECQSFVRGHVTSLALDLDSDYPGLASCVAAKSPLACFVALQLSNLGHREADILDKGFAHLHFLSLNGRYDHVMECLLNMSPIFLANPEAFWSSEILRKTVEIIITADLTYFKMAKDLITVDFPSPVLKELGNMFTKQFVDFEKYGLEKPTPIVELWLRTLMSLSGWNTNKNILFLVNLLCKDAFVQSELRAKIKTIFSEFLEDVRSKSNVGLFSWISGSKCGLTLLSPSSFEFPWFSFLALEAEEDRSEFTTIWAPLVAELSSQGDTTSLEKALKVISQRLKSPPVNSNCLPIYKWSQMILDTSADHPLQPILAQKFFEYFLARPSPGQPGVGKKFFEGIVNSLYFGRIQTKLKTIFEHFENVKDKENVLAERLCSLFKAFHFWTEDSIVLDSSLHLPSLAPYFLPDKLSLIIQNSQDLWLEYICTETLKTSQDKSVSEWNILHFRPQLGSSTQSLTRCRVNSATLLPSDRIIRRLRANDCPTPSPTFHPTSVHLFPFCDKMLTNPSDMKRSLSPIVKTVKEYARSFNEYKLECGGLIGAMSEFVEGLYVNVNSEVWAKASCLGSVGPKGQKLGCSGSAMVHHKFKEAKKQDVPDHQLALKRESFDKLCHSLLFQSPSQKILSSVILLENAAEYVLKMYLRYKNSDASTPPSPGLTLYTSLATTLFYLIVDECLSEEAAACPPLRYLISGFLEKLGETVISDQPSECIALLERLTSRPSLSPHLSQFFCPNVVDKSTFVEVYRKVSQLPDCNANLAFVLLSKMSVEGWIERCRPGPNEKSRLISLLGKAFHRSGLEPKSERTLLHGLHRRHLTNLTMCDFPEHFGEVVGLLLILTESQSLDPEIWYDVANALVKDDQQFHVHEDPDSWEEKCLAFSSQQIHIQLDEVLDFTRMMTQHFDKERRQVGLHGLYTKYQKYVLPLAANYCLQSNLLVTLMLKHDYGTQADMLVASIWDKLSFLYDAWLTPLHDHQRQETAAWIQQLAASQKLLLPWAPGDVKWASVMANTQAKCVALLHYTVPAPKSALSHFWEHYCRHYAHPVVKDYILTLVHDTLLSSLPWNTFYPRDEDLRLMVSVIDSFLPLCHEFLGRVFVEIPWSELFRRNPYALPRAISPLLHIAVKLAAEPQVRLSGRLLCLLRDATNLPWSMVDANTFESLIQWYIMSVDCKIILNHDQRHPLDTCILNLLRQASSLSLVNSEQSQVPVHTDLRKAQVYVRCKARLLISCGNKNKSFLASQGVPLKSSIHQLIKDVHFLCNLGQTSQKPGNFEDQLVRELLGLLNANTMSLLPETTLDALLAFLSNAGSRADSQALLYTLLRITANTVNDPLRVARLSEAVLEASFRDQEDVGSGDPNDSKHESTSTTWHSILPLLTLPSSSDKLRLVLDQCVVSGSCLFIFACLRKKRKTCQTVQDEQVLISSLLDWLRHIKLSEKCESKLPLLYSELILLCCRQLDCGAHPASVAKNILDFVSILSPLALGQSTTWNILGAIGLSSQYKPTPRGRFLALAMSYYLRSQLVEGPTLRTAECLEQEEACPEMLVKFYEESEFIKLKDALEGLRQTQAYLGLVDMLEWVLKMTNDRRNTFEAAQQFIEYLVVDNIYTENYLATSSNVPGSPYRAMVGHEEM